MHIVSSGILYLLALTIAHAGCGKSGCAPVVNDISTNSTDRISTQPLESLAKSLDGMRFISKKKHEGGLGPNGSVLRYWHVNFKNGVATWDYSDVQESGKYTLAADGSVSALMGSDGIVRGSFDTKTNKLVWDGKLYERDKKHKKKNANNDSLKSPTRKDRSLKSEK